MWLASNDTQTRYEQAVKEAILSEDKFKTFKSNSNYNCIVGMSDEWQAPLFYEIIKTTNPEVFKNLDKFKGNDIIGSPLMWHSNEGHNISPNTLRYLKTLCDLKNNFGPLDGFVVTELGIGYGGLSYVINVDSNLKDYVLCDLPNVQELAQKYLNHFDIKSTIDRNKYDKFDLFVSEFCLSEFNDEGIYTFYNDLVVKSDRIYLTMNLHDEDRKAKFIERIKVDFNITILDENPKTRWPNYIIIGKKK